MSSEGLVFMFPGQNSRYPEMIAKLAAESEGSARILADASTILGRDLKAHYRPGNERMFARNRDVQVGVFLANHLHMRRLEAAGVKARHSLGLSLGEYNHLVHIGALAFADALKLVDQRGALYGEGPAGVMVAVFPVEAEVVEQRIADLELGGKAIIGLYNSPRQQVLSGEREAVTRLVALLEEELAIMAVESEPNIPMHAPTFRPVAEKFAEVLARTRFETARLAYVPNVAGVPLANATPERIRECLTSHVCEPVRWRASIDAVAESLPSPLFVEVGPGSVLHNLFGRGWMPGRRARSDASENWPRHIEQLVTELGHGA